MPPPPSSHPPPPKTPLSPPQTPQVPDEDADMDADDVEMLEGAIEADYDIGDAIRRSIVRKSRFGKGGRRGGMG